ncbi:hypothetical protein [Streptomyces sp. NRRL WC-3618]|uniref:hypothetical protein n=1 Tax=Streptomyces sp. NRRL WC-3618 TaxID=1519490 RepID=UPI00131D25DA|nr:hypothetical protein [Streptomyces sp. NRRL WC-3618]
MAAQDRNEHVPFPDEHSIFMVEHGPFCFARCDCGWRGPARRARSLARTDGKGHQSGATA